MKITEISEGESIKYIVMNIDEPEYNRTFIVKALNKIDAINKVHEMYGEEYRKKDFIAHAIDGLEYVEGIYCIE